MKVKVTFADPVRVISFASVLWLIYVLVLTIISQSFSDPRHANNEIVFYLMLGGVALVCLGLSFWPWIQRHTGRCFIPLMITIITALPILAAWVTMILPGTNLMMMDSEGLVLRILPFLLVGFLLVAWQYRWPYMLLIVLGITVLNAAIIWSYTPPSLPYSQGGVFYNRPVFRGALLVPIIQSVVFLAVGFTISFLMTRLRKQQESLEAVNIRLTHYSSTLEQLATTRERSRLARELHDTLAHTLSGLAVQLETVKAYWDVDHEMARTSLEKSISTAHSGLEETRRALKALRASPLDDMGLAGAVEAMAAAAAARGNLALEVSISDNFPALSPDVEQAVYRIAQEAVTNVINHAGARNLVIRLEFADGKLKLTVCDDGQGFDVDKVQKSSQFGLTGMKERAQLIGADLNVSSETGKGTTVELII